MEEANIARVHAKNLSISTKHAIEISNFIRGKTLKFSKDKLQSVINGTFAIPFRRFNRDMGHKPNIAAGRYPQKAAKAILELLASLESNALNKGLNVEQLYIKQIIPNKASRPWHPSRLLRRRMKRTHIDIVATEREIKKEEKKTEQAKPIKK